MSFLKILLLLLVFNYAGSFVPFGIVPSIMLKALILILFCIVIYYSGVFSKDELLGVKIFVKSKRKSEV